jgi:DNA-binding transcriptional ArsR family regulator
MLWLLLNHRELCVCDIMEALNITQSKASRHLATLRHAGLVVDRKEATWSYYAICPVENRFERTLLEVLRAKLADHPGAARALRDLRAWMKRKERDSR